MYPIIYFEINIITTGDDNAKICKLINVFKT